LGTFSSEKTHKNTHFNAFSVVEGATSEGAGNAKAQ